MIKFRKRAPIWVFIWQIIQEKIRKPRKRKKIASFISYFLPKSKDKQLKVENPLLDRLANDGYCEMLNIISSEEIEEITNILTELPCYDPWRPSLGTFLIKNVPNEVHTAQIKNILSIPRLLEIANNPNVLEICEQYFGCKPIIDSIQAWWSLPGHNKPEQAENFHRDNDSIRFLKYFIYLTDVTEDSGPHIFVKNSHIEDKGLEIRRYEDNEIEKLFGIEKITKFTGDKGLSFIEDTYGFHKGQPPKTQKRLLLQIRYSITPTIFLSKNYIDINNISNLYYDKYINKYMYNE